MLPSCVISRGNFKADKALVLMHSAVSDEADCGELSGDGLLTRVRRLMNSQHEYQRG